MSSNVKIEQHERSTGIYVTMTGSVPRRWEVVCDPKCWVHQRQRRASGCHEFVAGSPAKLDFSFAPDRDCTHMIFGEIGCLDDPDGPTPLAEGRELHVEVSVEETHIVRGVICVSR